MVPVDAGIIRAIGYESAVERLHIQFKGGTFIFDNVPQMLHLCLMDVKDSEKSEFFRSNIKGIYEHHRVSEEHKTEQ